MRALIVILILVVVGFLAYTYITSVTEEEQQVKDLEKQFDQAVGDFLRAIRTMSGTGMDTTSDVDEAVRKIKKTKTELSTLIGTLKEDSALERGQKLMERIEEFQRKNDIKEY